MKTIIKILTIITVLLCTNVMADGHPVFPPEVMKPQVAPIYCGSPDQVYGHATATFLQRPIGWANVRPSGDPNTPVMAWLSLWYSDKTDSASIFMTVVENGETCLMGYGTEWTFDVDLLLDIVNKSFVEGDESTQ